MTLDKKRIEEIEQYERIYTDMPAYKMGDARMHDAFDDLRWAREMGCASIIDIGCGRGETLEYADRCGFERVNGTEVVDDLCGKRVFNCGVHELSVFPDMSFDAVTCFDVIEHLVRPDDELLIVEMSRIARCCLVVTANNRPSIDPATGRELHINKRQYHEWDQFIRDLLAPGWVVERCVGKRYVSETWRAYR